MLLFERLNCQPSKNAAGVLASADVLVTGVPSLQPGPGFCQFGDLDLGLGDIPFPLHREPRILSAQEGPGEKVGKHG